MPDSGFLFLSLGSLVTGCALYLAPEAISKLDRVLGRTLVTLDKVLLKHRYVAGLLAFVASYAFFRIALLLPSFRG